MNKPVREVVTFAAQNLIADPPFSKMDLVSCRNVLIYLEPEIQKRIIPLLHFVLNEGGCLFLGPSETIGRHIDLFEPISKKWRIYRRIGPSRLERVEFPISARVEPAGLKRAQALAGEARPGRFAELAQRVLLEEFVPAAVLINRKYEILYFFGPISRYLDVPSGEPTQDLMAMAREGLRTKLRAATNQASRDGETVTVGDVRVKRSDGYHPVTVTVKPVQRPRDAEGLLLITFADSAEGAPAPVVPVSDAEDSVVRQLEFELRATKEDLQSTIEELESANEELKGSNEEVMSMNEELQSANEELETSKEELQSLNEELSTVNNQLQEKVEDLETANNDMANLLNCTDVATVFLDGSLCIKRFTPATSRLFNLIATDVRRPIGDITKKFTDDALLHDAAQVLRDLMPQEQEVYTEDGRWCIRRILPYRTTDNRIEGVVITFSDVTELKRAGKRAQLLSTFLMVSIDAFTVHEFDGRILVWNRGAEQMYGYSEAEALRLNALRLIPEELHAELRVVWGRLRQGESVDSWESQRLTKDGRVIDVWVTASALMDETGRPVGIAKVERDVTERKKALVQLEQEVERRTAALRENEERLRAILYAIDESIITIDQSGTIESVNPAAERMFGYGAAEMVGQNIKLLMPPPYRDEHDNYISRYLQSGVKHVIGIGLEVEAQRKDGSCLPVDLSVSEVKGQGLFTGILRDITRRKELEREVVEIATLEQQRIGQNLHDDCGQDLTALGILADSLVTSLARHAPADAELALKIAQGMQRVLRQVRTLSRGLAQGDVTIAGLSAALTELTTRLSETSGVDCTFEGAEVEAVEDSIKATHLYHIAQEACTNALKHSRAGKVKVLLQSTDHAIILQVKDDGIGLPAQAGEGLGMRIMHNRAKVIGAELTIERMQPRGTVVTCTLKQEPSHGMEQA